MSKYPVNKYRYYHAHVYFDQDTLNFASALCKEANKLFSLKVGNIHKKAIGPHPQWSCQISFSSADFEPFIPWLENNRKELTILVHALTGDNLEDHTTHAYWLGREATLNLAIFYR